jgi:parvulin-like peptidyl-prolyl isomerase
MSDQVRASHLLVETKADAISIREEILSGRDFADAAEEFSICPSGQAGGDLGYFERGDMVSEFDQAAFELPVGELSEPIQTQFGWHLIIVTDKRVVQEV